MVVVRAPLAAGTGSVLERPPASHRVKAGAASAGTPRNSVERAVGRRVRERDQAGGGEGRRGVESILRLWSAAAAAKVRNPAKEPSSPRSGSGRAARAPGVRSEPALHDGAARGRSRPRIVRARSLDRLTRELRGGDAPQVVAAARDSLAEPGRSPARSEGDRQGQSDDEEEADDEALGPGSGRRKRYSGAAPTARSRRRLRRGRRRQDNRGPRRRQSLLDRLPIGR